MFLHQGVFIIRDWNGEQECSKTMFKELSEKVFFHFPFFKSVVRKQSKKTNQIEGNYGH